MSLVVVGLNHRTAPVSLLERLSISEEDLPKALDQLAGYEHVLEGVIVSTCNRVEVHAGVTKFHGGAQDLRNFFAEFCHVAPEDFADHLYTYHDDGAVRHLFRVAAGIDSMVVGESEILGQVRRAIQAATDMGIARRVLGAEFTRALRVGKRSRTETEIGRNPVSVSTAAVDLARKALGQDSLADKKVLVVGAGKMGSLAAEALTRTGVTDVTIVNRSEERRAALAERLGVEPLPWDELSEALSRADIVISSTTASHPVIDRPLVQDAIQGRDHPLFIIDIAVPRDVDPEVGRLELVVLRDIEDLRSVVETNVGSRVAEIAKVEEIISGEVQAFMAWQHQTEFAPTVAELVERADRIREAELVRAIKRLGTVDEKDRATIDHLTRRIVAKLLHVPISRVKELASSKQGYVYLDALRELFELDDDDLQ